MATERLATCPKRYSVDELLSLKSTFPVVNGVVEKLNKHPDIGVLEDSERLGPALLDVSNRRKALRNRRIETSSGQSEEYSSSKLSTGARQGQWHLRQRDISQRSSEPHSAPPGIAAQQNENFQRFYRAVVSPTHVRVTAGGRIVPNTRAVAPPKFDWNPDKCLFETHRHISDIEGNTQVHNLWLPHAPQPVIGSLLPHVHLPNYSLPQNAAFTKAGMTAQNLNGLDGQIQSSSENLQPSKEVTTDGLQPANLQQPIKISPPSQFDHSRPFVFNGQMVYPVPAGFQPPPNSVPLPITVLGDPNLQHQIPPMGNFLPQPYPMPIPMPLIMPPAGHLPMMLPNGGAHLEGGFPMAPYMPQPMPGLVSLSELTKVQIQGIRNQIKHIDNQLVNNKHQVDEIFLQRQRSELLVFIEKMEDMLHTQLGQETNHASVVVLNDQTRQNISSSHDSAETPRKVDDSGDGGVGNSSLVHSSATSNEELKNKASGALSQDLAPPVPLFVPASQHHAARTRSEGIQAAKASESKPSTKSEPVTKSRLTVAAAMAPPFQPRAHTMAQLSEIESAGDIARQASKDSVTSSNPILSTPQYGALRDRRTAHSSSDWSQAPPYTGVDHASLSRAQSMQVSHVLEAKQVASLPRANTFHAPLSTYEAVSKPYLIGTLPNGVHPSEANGSSIVYSRPLTEEEIRARHLYWGDAPRSALRGLPKFDGKDFYPPSPVKGMATPATASNAVLSSTITNYQTPPQVRTKSSDQNLVPTPTRAFLQNDIIGFQSPSPRPATYTFDNRLPQHWSSTYYGRVEESSQKKVAHPFIAQSSTPDFSTLFTSPTAPQHNISSQSLRAVNSRPTTPQNKASRDLDDRKEDDHESLDSWGAPKHIEPNYRDVEDLTSVKTNTVDSQSSSSTVEIRLTSDDKVQSPKRLADRQANFYGGDPSTLFLQNMLRNTAAAAMSAPAVSGTVSSATAQGYLPSLRGSAAASLAPAMLNTLTTMEREDQTGLMKIDHIKISADGNFEVSTEGVAPLIAKNFSPENRPLDRDRPHRPVRASVETLGAEGYLRYLTEKAEADKKIVEDGWNSNTTGTGPVMGSDW